VRVVVSVDVEEEGLFSGAYPRRAPGVRNVARLPRLAFITREFGIPLTLLATYPVAQDSEAMGVLRDFRARLGAEIGAHLHPWNTPPFPDLGLPEPVRPGRLPPEVLRQKLETLAAALHEAVGERPRAFRMGRFDLDESLFPALAQAGFTVDGSLVPLRVALAGPDHFLAPADPYLTPAGGLVETPLTVVPLVAGSPQLLAALCRFLPRTWGEGLRRGFRFVGAVGLPPAMFSLPAMRLAARLHRRRGGRVLHLFLHSSELLPGASPQFPTEASVARLMEKIRAFLTWLQRQGLVRGLTMSALAAEIRQLAAKP
jgi:peptidoglycan/xylan/chitin deacetylase (PgdA/CDA1 family)